MVGKCCKRVLVTKGRVTSYFKQVPLDEGGGGGGGQRRGGGGCFTSSPSPAPSVFALEVSG